MTVLNEKKDAYGTLYSVGKGMINVFTAGTGKHTAVFLAGAGVTSPVLEYKPLFSRLTDDFRIVVVEKSGYGLSRSTGTPRTVENMVNESREALKAAGIAPPYILVPHSYSGFETVYWANTYPDEVTAVFSIDMGIPETAIEMSKVISQEKKSKMNDNNKRIYKAIQKRGLIAKMFKKSAVDASGMMSADYLDDSEKKLYEDLFYKNLSNNEMFDESLMMTENAQKALNTGKLRVPAFFWISDMKTFVKGTTWRELAVKYAESIGAEYTLTDQGHLMYSKVPDKMADSFRKFAGTLV